MPKCNQLDVAREVGEGDFPTRDFAGRADDRPFGDWVWRRVATGAWYMYSIFEPSRPPFFFFGFLLFLLGISAESHPTALTAQTSQTRYGIDFLWSNVLTIH